MSKNKKQKYYGHHNTDKNKKEMNSSEVNENKLDVEAVEPEDTQGENTEGFGEAGVVDNFDAIEDGDMTPDAEGETEAADEDSAEKEIESLKAQLEKEKKEYLFLMAEFDNFRKRTLREKSEIIKNAGENVFKGLLPIVDDMERGIKASENATDVDTVREGLILIYNKLKKYMEQNGVKEFDQTDDTFDADKHEAITAVPVEDTEKKGKILDTVEKGYTINDKVLRHAKVVVGQ